jgi:hypothetical protein
MGGPSATDDLELGYITQAWLAAADETAALVSGQYWFHQRIEQPHHAVHDEVFQDALLAALAEHTGIEPLTSQHERSLGIPSAFESGLCTLEYSALPVELHDRHGAWLEVYSVDEAFLGVEGTPHELLTLGRTMKAAVRRNAGVPVCVGIGHRTGQVPGQLPVRAHLQKERS